MGAKNRGSSHAAIGVQDIYQAACIEWKKTQARSWSFPNPREEYVKKGALPAVNKKGTLHTTTKNSTKVSKEEVV